VVEEIQKQRFDDVVAMVAERDFREAFTLGEVVQRAATQARAQAAHRLAFRHDALDHAVGVLLDNVERHADAAQIIRQHVGIVVRLFLIKMHGDELEAYRRLGLQLPQ